jgi:quercetin dioxygenase-like cupin family protein
VSPRHSRKHAIARKSDESRALWLLGGLYEILVSGEETGGKVTVMRMTAPAGTGSPPHTHPGEESLYLLDGELNIHIGDDVISAKPGSAFYFPAGTLEFFEAVTQATVLITYTPGGVDKFFAEVGEPAATRTLPPPSDAPPDFERLVRVAAEHGMDIRLPH